MEFRRHCSFASRIVINLDKKDFLFEELQLANGKVRHFTDSIFGPGMREMKLYGIGFFGLFLGHFLDFFFLDHFRGGVEHTIITEGGVVVLTWQFRFRMTKK